MKNYTKLKDLVASIEADAKKFYEQGNGAAGTRVRKSMLAIKDLTADIRKEVIELRNAGQKEPA